MNKTDTVCRKYHHITVNPISGALGAEITGVKIAGNLKPEVISEIHQAFLDYQVIFFHNQEITPQDQLTFAKLFGKPIEYPIVKGLPDFPLITPVVKLEHERWNFGGIWHSDTTYLECPPTATILHGVEIPPYGGDTLFANQYMAYETLSEGLKTTLDSLVGINRSTNASNFKMQMDKLQGVDQKTDIKVGVHPVVRTHPETGRKALYVNINHTKCFQGWTEEESQPLLNYLFTHQVKPEFTCRFRWQQGSLAFWDNRCTQHNPVNDYHGFKRVMHRIVLAGDKPY